VQPITSPSQNQVNVVSIPGLHIVANFGVTQAEKLTAFEPFQNFISDQISAFNLTQIGEVYHNFENGGYTAVICLTESHLSIHTWPENNYATFDIFLSNHLKDNRVITRSLYTKVKEYFAATVLFEQIIER
jgi:S-adenosylmethionine decarboxylase